MLARLKLFKSKKATVNQLWEHQVFWNIDKNYRKTTALEVKRQVYSTLQKNFPLRISSVNVTKSAVFCAIFDRRLLQQLIRTFNGIWPSKKNLVVGILAFAALLKRDSNTSFFLANIRKFLKAPILRKIYWKRRYTETFLQ